jgi:AraC-like DNA-binding protein
MFLRNIRKRILMIDRFGEILNIVAVFQYFLFSVFLLSRGRTKGPGNRLLAGFLLSKTVCIIDILISDHGRFFYDRFPQAFFVFWPFAMLYMPLLYLYSLSMTRKNWRMKPVHVLMTLPFLVILALATVKYHVYDAESKRRLLTAGMFSPAFWNAYTFAYYAQVFGYLGASLVVLKKFTSGLKEYYSSIERINLSWLKTVLYGFLGVYGIVFLGDVNRILTGRTSGALGLALNASFLAFVTVLIFKGLKQPDVPGGIEEKPKPRGLSLDTAVRKRYAERLKEVMGREKPYLLPSITLDQLAEKMSVPPRHLSYLINTDMNQNFFDLINSYRIEEAKSILRERAEKRRTVLEVLYEVGFNSKSVFNTAFKKHTGVTPKEFKKLNTA